MTCKQGSIHSKGLREKIERIAKQEGTALFIAASIFIGAAMFFLIMRSIGRMIPAEWWWLALAAALLSLPKVFKALLDSEEPYLVRFARAFRAGFWAVLSIFSDFSGRLIKLPWQTVEDDKPNHRRP